MWADPIGSRPKYFGYPSWEEGCRRGMRLSDGATWIPLGMLGFVYGCTGRAVRWVILKQDEKC